MYVFSCILNIVSYILVLVSWYSIIQYPAYSILNPVCCILNLLYSYTSILYHFILSPVSCVYKSVSSILLSCILYPLFCFQNLVSWILYLISHGSRIMNFLYFILSVRTVHLGFCTNCTFESKTPCTNCTLKLLHAKCTLRHTVFSTKCFLKSE